MATNIIPLVLFLKNAIKVDVNQVVERGYSEVDETGNIDLLAVMAKANTSLQKRLKYKQSRINKRPIMAPFEIHHVVKRKYRLSRVFAQAVAPSTTPNQPQ